MKFRELGELNREELKTILNSNESVKKMVLEYILETEAQYVDNIMSFLSESIEYYEVRFNTDNEIRISNDWLFIEQCLKATDYYNFLNEDDIVKFEETLREIEDFRDNFSIEKIDDLKENILECEHIAFRELEYLTDMKRIEKDNILLLEYFDDIAWKYHESYIVDEDLNVYEKMN